ncbi:MAG: hypothetical protein HC942_06345 [Microcoleus sp. SU_5_6]|nr:hypothetical protein [Microcoleus sp. SU_5_6]
MGIENLITDSIARDFTDYQFPPLRCAHYQFKLIAASSLVMQFEKKPRQFRNGHYYC